ncbi:uncharacterized protein [Asterias amurensis]|uniref:uncharacterized protein isoform X1 n=1 Tax=Asterias amurensis TaxID=7602 RepID=UPI003AB1552A
MYGRDFIVTLPLDGWKLEAAGSFLQIACVSGGLDPKANSFITLIGSGYSETFTAAPSASIVLTSFKQFLLNTSTNILYIKSDLDIVVTLFLQIGKTLSAYTAMPIASLDKVHLVASYGLLEDNLSELTVVGTAPTQSITFNENADNVTLQSQGGVRPLSCNVLHNQSCVYQTSNDFIGGHLQSPDPLMAIVESRCSDEASGCLGHSMDSLYPLVALGQRYTAVAVDSLDVSGTFRAVAVWNNTVISWSDSKNVTLANGQTKDLSYNGKEVGTIKGSKPFLLLHHIERGLPAIDIALVTVPPHEQLTRKTITFSTYKVIDKGQSQVKSFITIINPCGDEILLQRISSTRPRTVPTVSQSSTVVHLSEDEATNVCGSSRDLEPGVYTLEVSPDKPRGSYSAILYTVTENGVAAHILATELNQVVCSVEPSEKVHLCPTKLITIQPPTVTAKSEPPVTIHGGEQTNNATGTIIPVVIAILTGIVGAIVIAFFMFRWCKRRRWKRLEEGEYMEDNPIRLHVLDMLEQEHGL